MPRLFIGFYANLLQQLLHNVGCKLIKWLVREFLMHLLPTSQHIFIILYVFAFETLQIIVIVIDLIALLLLYYYP